MGGVFCSEEVEDDGKQGADEQKMSSFKRPHVLKTCGTLRGAAKKMMLDSSSGEVENLEKQRQLDEAAATWLRSLSLYSLSIRLVILL